MPALAETGLPLVQEHVSFRADAYALEGMLAYPETGGVRGAAVLAGPHPLLGGNMDNNVVRALGDGLAERGLLTLRFNYRGVGRSEGPEVDVARHLAQFWKTSHVADEMDLGRDVQAAVAFIRQVAGGLPLALIGYSFGCALLSGIHAEDGAPCLVLIAPTVGRHDYAPFQGVSNPLLVIASEDDFATGASQLRGWFDTLRAPRELVLKRFDNHFFRGHETWLTEAIFDFLCRHWR